MTTWHNRLEALQVFPIKDWELKILLAGRGGIEPPSFVLEAKVLPLDERPVVAGAGFEPAVAGL